MSVIGLDSATPPTAPQVAAARTAGITVWSGYLASKANVGLLRPWSQAEFAVVRALPGMPIAFCSGWDDPVRCRAQAQAWSVRLCLDVEGGIRGDGPWVQPWLDASEAGLYGTSGVHLNRRAVFHIAAWYVTADPGRAWPGGWPRPATPCGWQWHNSHNEFGVTVDRSWLDDWFGGSFMAALTDDEQRQMYNWLANLTTVSGTGAVDPTKWPLIPPGFSFPKELADIKAAIAALSTGKPAAPFDATITPKP